MRRSIGVAAVAALLMSNAVGVTHTRATIVTPYASTGSQPVIDGIVHEWGTSEAEFQTETGPETTTQPINILRVDPTAPDIHFETALPFDRVNGRQWTTGQAARESRPGHQVVAAVNGDFWRTTNSVRSPVDLNIRNGELVAMSPGQRGAVGFREDGTPVIGRAAVDMSITLPGASPIALGGINVVRDPDEVILYTPTFDAGTATDSTGVEVVLSGVTLPLPTTGTYSATVESVNRDVMNTTIPRDSVVLSATGAYADELSALSPNDTVQVDVAIEAGWQDVVNAVGGIRILVHEGVAATDFTTKNEIVRNARLSAGITAEGEVILVTIDGSENGHLGLTQGDLAQLMASLGAVEAINLDGGGSATMAVDPAGDAPLGVVNVPADGHQRRVNTTLMVVSTASQPQAAPVVTAPVMRLTPGTSSGKGDAAVDISWQATDADGHIASTELQRLDSNGIWQTVALPTPTTTTINRRLKFKKDLQYRVRVTDDSGNQSEWVVGRVYLMHPINERAPAIARSGKWPLESRSTAIGGQFGRSNVKTGSGQSVTMTYAAVQVAWIGPAGPNGGAATIQLDGIPSGTVSLLRNKTRARVVLFVGPPVDESTFVTAPPRTIKVTNISPAKRPYVNLDAFLVLTVR